MAGTLADVAAKEPATKKETVDTESTASAAPPAGPPVAPDANTRSLADVKSRNVLANGFDPDEPMRYFKHRAVPRFVIKMGKLPNGRSGDFIFEKGVCSVPLSRVDEFLDACANLTPIDFNNIVEILNIQNEVGLGAVTRGAGSTVVRGTVTTDTVKDPQKNT